MLQAPDYMRALMTSPYGVRSAVEADKYVEARMRRQKRLDGPDAVHFTAMLTEAVLLQHPWGPKVQIAQLRHIKSLIEAHPDTVDVRVIPLGAPECAALSGNVYLLDFESCWLPTVAWFENALFGALVEDPVQARNLNYVYNNVFAAMPDQGRSLDLIDQAVHTLTSLAGVPARPARGSSPASRRKPPTAWRFALPGMRCSSATANICEIRGTIRRGSRSSRSRRCGGVPFSPMRSIRASRRSRGCR